MKHRKLVVGNWKMNPRTLEEAKHILRKTKRAVATLTQTGVAVCPPFVFVPAALAGSKDVLHVGAQTVSFEVEGPHTGEVSASMLADMGIEYVIAGHSEERTAGDTDSIVSKRILAALDAGLVPIVCIGELARDEGGAHFDFLREQIKATFTGIPTKYGTRIILAYEPVWAIGGKEAMNPEQIYEMSLFVKKVFADIFDPAAAQKVPVLYGGSVNFRNAGDIMTIGKVDGLLVGRESVNAVGFVELLKAVDAAA